MATQTLKFGSESEADAHFYITVTSWLPW